jgi:hypothetical protein
MLPVFKTRGLLTVLAATAVGCQTYGSQGDQPARIVNPDDASRTALQQVVNEVFGTEVLLADDAFTTSSLLTIEHTPPATIDNPNPQGRVMQGPYRLHLVISGSDCIVIDERDDSRHALVDTNCEPLSN